MPNQLTLQTHLVRARLWRASTRDAYEPERMAMNYNAFTLPEITANE
jgi:hypothetical protein